MDEPPVRTLSHYRLIEKIGEGGMGVVWKAEDTILGRIVAIKILPSDVSRDEHRRAMFLDEARAASAASHAHVVQVHEFGHERGLDFIVMEYVDGRPLGKILVGRPLPPDKVAQLGVPIALALQAAHRKGLLHRDLKPSNVLVTADGDVKVVDFGLAALFAPHADDDATETQSQGAASHSGGTIAGTLAYMSPEQARGELLDARSDVFSLGIVLYEMATGQRPFAGATPAEVVRAITTTPPTPVHELVPSVPLDLERIIMKALARKPGERYQTMDDFAVDLKRLDRDLESGSAPSYEELRGAGSIAPPSGTTLPVSAAPPARGRSFAIAGSIAVAAVALLAGGWWIARGVGPHLDATKLLVLPFDVHGGEGDKYLGQALAEAVAVNFAEVPALRVLPVPLPADPPADPVGAARAAGAGRVLAGSLSREGGVLHLSLKLVDVKDDRLIGGILRDETHPDLTLLASGIAAELSGKMRVVARHAYEFPLYLAGDPRMVGSADAAAVLAAWKSGGTVDATEPARRLVAAYPNEIGALALYAYLLDQRAAAGVPKAQEQLTETLAAIDRLDPANPYATFFRAGAREHEHSEDARRMFASIANRDDLTPACRAWFLRSLATMTLRQLNHYSWLDAPKGPAAAGGDALRPEIDALRRSVALDPANAWSQLYLSWALHLSGSNDETIGLAQHAVALEPGFNLPRTTLASYLAAAGRWPEVVELLRPICSGTSREFCGLLAVASKHVGDNTGAKAAALRAEAGKAPTSVELLQLARFALLENDPAKAKTCVERAVAAGLPPERLAIEPDLAALAPPKAR